ncbi:hypothetical protein GOODEAATRI_026498 [Goodea atripinnis]|uniref:Uncharacterized protein n=1 Tax=Goodea atripinnis TaxID=208336 RepID=A0ABV0NNG3_9TELE
MMAGKMAKKATQNHVNFTVHLSKSEAKSIVKQKLKEEWQKRWDGERKGRWFYRIKKAVGKRRTGRRSRKEERVIRRLRTYSSSEDAGSSVLDQLKLINFDQRFR